LIAIGFRRPSHERRDEPTRTTPGGPKINQHGAGSLQHLRFKTGIREIDN
jgi:hypothetical protein